MGNLQAQLMDTTKSFQSVLKLRNENIKGSEDRRKIFSSTSSVSAGGPSSSAGGRSGASLNLPVAAAWLRHMSVATHSCVVIGLCIW